MIAIMPNTISREILSAGRVRANRAKNNNEMSTENKGGLRNGWQKNQVEERRDGRVREESKATGNRDRECHERRKKQRGQVGNERKMYVS